MPIRWRKLRGSCSSWRMHIPLRVYEVIRWPKFHGPNIQCLCSRDGLILLDLKGAALHPDVISAIDRLVHELGLVSNVALYTLPESEDMSKQWRGQFICGYKVIRRPLLLRRRVKGCGCAEWERECCIIW